jgi:hypothetical protein
MRAAGSSYTARLASAGTYPFGETSTGAIGRIGVGLVVKPTSGTMQTSFTIRWGSSLALPPGVVTDVQVARPNVPGGWTDCRRGETGPSDTFVPDAGAGTYQFRVRVRSTVTGASSLWSGIRMIQVS